MRIRDRIKRVLWRRFESAVLARALDESGGVISRAANRLGMDRSRLSKLRTRLGVTVK